MKTFIVALAILVVAVPALVSAKGEFGQAALSGIDVFNLATEWAILLAVSLTSILAILVATQMGGFVGTGYRFIAAGLFFFGVLRDVFQFINWDNAQDAQKLTELVGTLILLIGFFFIYRSIRKLMAGN